MPQNPVKLAEALWRIYRRPDPPNPWEQDGNLPWNDPSFSERMLVEHLDQAHNAASRTHSERHKIVEWLWPKLELEHGDHVLDFTCGPGQYAVDLARRGCHVTGIDFSPASIAYARECAQESGVQELVEFIEQDVRLVELETGIYDAALFLYGQLAVFRREEALPLLSNISGSLKKGGRLVVELLNQDRVDKKASSWWFTDDKGLWGESPFLHLGERVWLADEQLSVERYFIFDLLTQEMRTINLADQTYAIPEMVGLLKQAGFNQVDTYIDWGTLDLYDRDEWVVYVAEK